MPRWRYILPNLVTCVGLTAGLLSISEAITGDYRSSAWFIFLSVLLDKLDGTVARALKASSRFGMELDSLSDLITFGVAPGVLVLALMGGTRTGGLDPNGLLRPLTYLGCFLYVIGAALRLAKFNVMSEHYGKEYFFGLPTTACGALVSMYFLTVDKYGLPEAFVQALPAGMILLALLMVSRLPLPKWGLRHALWLNVFQGVNFAFIYIFGFFRIFPEYILTCGLTYLFVGMGWALVKGVRPPPQLTTE